MKKILFVLVAAISVVSSVGQAVRFYISTNDLVAASHNPSSQNPLGIVLDTNDFSYTTWEWWGDSTITNTPGPLYLQSLRPGVDGSYVLFENLHWNRAPDLGGSNIFVVINNTNQGGIVGALTVPYLPRAINTNRLADSHLYWDANGTGTDTNLFFGPGKTNVFYRTNGTDLAFYNGYSGPKFSVVNGAGNGVSMTAQGTSSTLETYGSSSAVTLRAGSDNATLTAGLWKPTTDRGLSLGDHLVAWDSSFVSNSFVRGFRDNTYTNFVRLNTRVDNTTAIIDLQAKTNNVDAPITGFSFQTNGVPLFTITGTGGPSSGANWTAVGTTDSALAGTATINTTIKAGANLLETPELYTGSFKLYRGALTPADAGVSLDFSSTNRYWSISLTGAVTFATANLTAGKHANVMITGVATNAAYTWPANWVWIGYKPTYLTATKHADLYLKSTGTTDAGVWAYYGEEQ